MKRETAYHEAAHAAILWMFGCQPECIDMWGNKRYQACVRCKPLWSIPPYPRGEMPNEATRLILRGVLRRQVMCNLAGYAAENRLGERSDGIDWFDERFEWGEWECEESDDINKAFSSAEKFFGSE